MSLLTTDALSLSYGNTCSTNLVPCYVNYL